MDLDFVLYNLIKHFTYKKNRTTIEVNKFKKYGVVRCLDEDKIVITYNKKEKQDANIKDLLNDDIPYYPFAYYKRESFFEEPTNQIETIIIAKELETIRQAVLNDMVSMRIAIVSDMTVIYDKELVPFKIGYYKYDNVVEYLWTKATLFCFLPKDFKPIINFDIYELHIDDNDTLYLFSSNDVIRYYDYIENKYKAKIVKNGKELEIREECYNTKTHESWVYNGDEVDGVDIIVRNMLYEEI